MDKLIFSRTAHKTGLDKSLFIVRCVCVCMRQISVKFLNIVLYNFLQATGSKPLPGSLI